MHADGRSWGAAFIRVDPRREPGNGGGSSEVEADDGILTFELTFDGDTIEGTCSGVGPQGEKMPARLHVTRAG